MLLFQARATTDLLNRLSYFTCDIEIREIVSFKISSIEYYKNKYQIM